MATQAEQAEDACARTFAALREHSDAFAALCQTRMPSRLALRVCTHWLQRREHLMALQAMLDSSGISWCAAACAMEPENTIGGASAPCCPAYWAVLRG
jgi:uncharacterized protein YjiS (DUF1127 family)